MLCLEKLPGGSLFRIKRTQQHGLDFPKLHLNKTSGKPHTNFDPAKVQMSCKEDCNQKSDRIFLHLGVLNITI